MKVPKNSKVRLCIDFLDAAKLKEWEENAKELGVLPESAEVYHIDGLDVMTTGVPQSRTYILRRKGERLESQLLKIKHRVEIVK